MYPQYMTARVGDTVEFRCTSVEEVEWKFFFGPPPFNAQQYRFFRRGEYFLKLVDVDYTNRGLYECRGEKVDKQYFFSHGALDVKGEFVMSYYCNHENIHSERL